jgi:hypothetical protein
MANGKDARLPSLSFLNMGRRISSKFYFYFADNIYKPGLDQYSIDKSFTVMDIVTRQE